MDHPLQEYKDKPLSPERIQTVKLDRRSHKIMRPKITGNMLNAHIETASGTEAGKGFADRKSVGRERVC